PSAAEEGDHLLRAQSLPPWVGLDPSPDIGQDIEMTAAAQVRDIARLDQSELELPQAARGTVVKGKARDIGERFAGPAGERGVEQPRRAHGPIDVEEEHGEQRALARCRDLDHTRIDFYANRAEHTAREGLLDHDVDSFRPPGSARVAL